ncbi:hypothetical protein GCM10010294_34240 [Streptomyces griseoloalbus]|nr:hypothetical protein GCM10010294_34240 [Streptomyces griseoloalbus]
MELAGPRGALMSGGLIIAGSIGAGHLLRSRRTPAPVLLRTPDADATGRPALEAAA